MKEDKIKLLERYLKGQLSTVELDLFFKSLEESDSEQIQAVIKAHWDNNQIDPLPADILSRIKSGVLTKIKEEERAVKPVIQLPQRGSQWRVLGWVASIAILLGALFWMVGREWDIQEVIVSTAEGEQLEWILPDQTKVILNENSTIRYAQSFDTDSIRSVSLEGEAYFEVVKEYKRKRKFKVVTTDISVDVLGTVFNVNTNAVETQVYLEEGSIALTMNNEIQQTPILMKPGEVVTYSIEEHRIIDHTKGDAQLEWKDNILFFTKMDIADVIHQLEENYNIEITLENKTILDRKITAGIPNNDLRIAIQTLEKILGEKLNVKQK